MTPCDLETRIARLERRNRLLAGGVVALALGCATGLGLARAQPAAAPPADLVVRSLAVVDPAGVTRVRIAAPLPDPIVMGRTKPRDGGVSGILLFDAKGNERGGYATSDSKTYPNVFLTLDDERRQRVLFLAEPGGATTLRLFKDKATMAQLNLVDDQPGLQLIKDGKTLFRAPSPAPR